ncbi:MAG: cold shock domain-containing protein [Bacteroidetes bacterium]|nr:cold shock domain-containing protein [Bacteroidota bacterium]
MAKPKQTYQKNENEKKRKRKQQEKEDKRALRKASSNKGKGLESMMAYIDHNGQLTDTPPDPKLKVEIKAEDILLGARSFVREESSDLKSGKVVIYNADKGFGFIKNSISQEKVFFHVSEADYDIREGDLVSYNIVHGARGLSAAGITKQK